MTPATARLGSLAAWPGRAEAWLDERGRPAWIAAMVLGFIVFWPAGLAILAYMIWMPHRTAWTSTGNAAFDAYKADTLRRLEDEQVAFESFLQRLREAKDKQEFDAFMDERARTPATAEPHDAK